MKTKDRLDEIEAQLDHITNRIDNLRDKFVAYIEESNKIVEPKLESAPLIKDEKIRKIIREWAGENDSTRAVYYSPKNALADSYGNSISFNLIFRELNHGVEYTITELCGEEE